MSVVEYAWQDRDNQFLIKLDTVTGGATEAADLADVSKAVLEMRQLDGADGPEITINRDDVGAIINWWDPALATGEMRFTLGLWPAATFIYNEAYKARLTLTTANSPNGIVWISYGDSYLTPLSVTFFETE
jgi:hypothetical protein